MQEVSNSIDAIDGVNHAVASATHQQNTVIQTLDSDIHHISDLSLQGSNNLTATLEECKSLKLQFDELEQMVLKLESNAIPIMLKSRLTKAAFCDPFMTQNTRNISLTNKIPLKPIS